MPVSQVKPAVLIVDGHAPLRRALRRLLRGLGVDLRDAATGADALALLEQHPHVAAIIAEHELGAGISGLELLEQAQRRKPGTAAFLYTGERLLTVEVWREAFVTIIAKPAPFGRLRRAIAQAVRQ